MTQARCPKCGIVQDYDPRLRAGQVCRVAGCGASLDAPPAIFGHSLPQREKRRKRPRRAPIQEVRGHHADLEGQEAFGFLGRGA